MNDTIKKSGGFTLIEVILSSFILCVVGLLTAGTLQMYYLTKSQVDASSSATGIVTQILVNSQNIGSFFNSAVMQQNPDLASCIFGSQTCNYYIPTDFVYYDSVATSSVDANGNPYLDSNGNATTGPAPLAGTTALGCSNLEGTKVPVFYGLDGHRCLCTDPAESCPFQAIATYTAFCPLGGSCSTANSLGVTFQVKQRAGLPNRIPALANFTSNVKARFVKIADSNSLFLKFVSAQSVYTNAAGNKQASAGSVSEFDIANSTPLTFIPGGSIITMTLAFATPTPIANLSLYRYEYPVGCSPSNVGTLPIINGMQADCSVPTLTQFTPVPLYQPAITNPTQATTVTLGNVAGHPDIILNDNQMYEFRATVSNSSGTQIAETVNRLRTIPSDQPTLSVTAPGTFWDACDPNYQGNVFTFNAQSNAGWEPGSLIATVVQMNVSNPQTYSFPGFASTFLPNTANYSLQLALPPGNLIQGATYAVSFQGTTMSNVVVDAQQATFYVTPRPAPNIQPLLPVSASQERTVSPLTASAQINVNCGTTPTSLTFGITNGSTGAQVMPDTDMTSTCALITSPRPDQMLYSCSEAFACNVWLGISDPTQCASTFPAATLLTGNFKLTEPSNTNPTASVSFWSSSKITVQVTSNNVQWAVINTAGPPAISLAGQSAPAKLTFNSPFLAGESAKFQLAGNSGTYSFTCTDSSNCGTTIPTPSGADVFTLTTLTPNLINIGTPSTITFKYVDDTTLACTATTPALTCPSGQTLHRRMDVLGGPYGYSWGSNGPYSISNYTLYNPSNSTLDFFLTYIPQTSLAPDFTYYFDLVETTTSTSSASLRGTWLANSPTACSPDLSSCPADIGQTPASAFATFVPFVAGKTFSLTLQAGNLTTTAPGQGGTGVPGIAIVRQCYCQ